MGMPQSSGSECAIFNDQNGVFYPVKKLLIKLWSACAVFQRLECLFAVPYPIMVSILLQEEDPSPGIFFYRNVGNAHHMISP